MPATPQAAADAAAAVRSSRPASAAPLEPSQPDDQQAQIDEIRASLREFREAVRELTESRARRRYF